MPITDDLSSVSIVVLSYNRKEALERNLGVLVLLEEATGCEVVVVDNASTDGSQDVIRAATTRLPGLVVLLNDRNLGVAAGRNAGWSSASRDYILNIDDDTFVTAEAVAAMLMLLQERPEIGIVSPRIVHARTGASQLDFGTTEYRLGNFHGACHMLRRSLLQQIGYNDEACTFGGEELDLSIRSRAAGWDVVYTPHATVRHDSHPRPGREGRERRSRWLYNFVRVHHKHLPLLAAIPLSLRYMVSHLVAGLRSDGVRAAPALLTATWRGVCHGRRQRRLVPNEVVRFYTDPALRPDLGNVPLWSKLRRRHQ